MDNWILGNHLVRYFEECTTIELRMALDEMKLWGDGVARGLVKPELANRYIESAKRLANLKLHALGFPEFPA